MTTQLKRFFGDRRANVAIIFALCLVPLMLGMAVGLDYVSTSRQWTKLNAISDAAALTAVTPNMMTQSATVAQTAAKNMFMAQAAMTPGLSITASNVSVSVVDAPGAAGTIRNVTINYAGTRNTAFAGILGSPTMTFKHTSGSSAATNPNTDFYVLLDTSPSMAIAATQAGIDTMVGLTPSQGGCAFACHQSNPGADNLGNRGGVDNYAVARANNVQLRIDLVNSAMQSLIQTAQSTEATNHATYRMGVGTFDYTDNYIAPLNVNLSTVAQQSANIQVLQTCKNGWVTCSNNDGDVDTNWDQVMNDANALIPTPGNGTNNAGDTPKAFVFIVTDGVIDESNGGRQIAPMGGAWCTTLKSRGIKIAVLYTTYNPLPTNSFYNSYVAPFQPTIATNMQTCASPGFFTEVNTNGDITAALNALFIKAVGSAHLTQ